MSSIIAQAVVLGLYLIKPARRGCRWKGEIGLGGEVELGVIHKAAKVDVIFLKDTAKEKCVSDE